jgi:hypothetical protein
MMGIDLYLDGQMKIKVYMGIPSLFYHLDENILSNESKLDKTIAITEQMKHLKHLLVGTETDPHMV